MCPYALVVGVDLRRLCGCLVGLLALSARAVGELLRQVLALLCLAVALLRVLPQLLGLSALLGYALRLRAAAADHERCEHDDCGDGDHDPDPGGHGSPSSFALRHARSRRPVSPSFVSERAAF